MSFFLRVTMTLWRKKNPEELKQKNEAFGGCRSTIKRHQKESTELVVLSVAANTICILECSLLILLFFSLKTIYWSLLINQTLDVVTLVLEKESFFSSLLVYVIFPSWKKSSLCYLERIVGVTIIDVSEKFYHNLL